MDPAGLRPMDPPLLPTRPPTAAEIAEEKKRLGLSTFKSQSGWKGTGKQSVHPLVWTHPITGAKAIMAHTLLMSCLQRVDGEQLSWEESGTLDSARSGFTSPSAFARLFVRIVHRPFTPAPLAFG